MGINKDHGGKHYPYEELIAVKPYLCEEVAVEALAVEGTYLNHSGVPEVPFIPICEVSPEANWFEHGAKIWEHHVKFKARLGDNQYEEWIEGRQGYEKVAFIYNTHCKHYH